MPKTTNSAKQEEFVAKVASNMAKAHEGDGNVLVRSGSRNLIRGASGFRHQIDVSVQIPKDLVLYECKHWGANVDPEALLALVARGIDIQRAHPDHHVSLNIVVKNDLTSGAELLAKFFGIRRHLATSPAEFSLGYKTDWQASLVGGTALNEAANAQTEPIDRVRRRR